MRQTEENAECGAINNQQEGFTALLKRGIMALDILVITLALLVVNLYFSIPSRVMLYQGDEYVYSLTSYSSNSAAESSLIGKGARPARADVSFNNAIRVSADEIGNYAVEVTALGAIPVKTMTVDVVQRQSVVPLGTSVGLKIAMDGLLVVNVSDVQLSDGRAVSPAKDSGIKTGDIITTVNNVKITSIDTLTDQVGKSGEAAVTMDINRDGKHHVITAMPAFDSETGEYKLGIWVRDGTTGIGTMTFYDPHTGRFAALGHGITDIDTGKLFTVQQGWVLPANVVSVKKGEKGTPGELKGHLIEGSDNIADIRINNNLGVYGEYNKALAPSSIDAIPVALRDQIHTGEARILTIAKGNTPESYTVEIEKLFRNSSDTNKGMVVRITDKRLLDKTGGIVQGMSGSPIIQNNMIIGAITHVFVNDPERGYGTYIDTMMEQLDKII